MAPAAAYALGQQIDPERWADSCLVAPSATQYFDIANEDGDAYEALTGSSHEAYEGENLDLGSNSCNKNYLHKLHKHCYDADAKNMPNLSELAHFDKVSGQKSSEDDDDKPMKDWGNKEEGDAETPATEHKDKCDYDDQDGYEKMSAARGAVTTNVSLRRDLAELLPK